MVERHTFLPMRVWRAKKFLGVQASVRYRGVMSPMRSTSATGLLEERDPFWEAVLASPVLEDDLSDEERAALDDAMNDLRAGRLVSRDQVFQTIERMRQDQSE
jgi:hypothetical protein